MSDIQVTITPFAMMTVDLREVRRVQNALETLRNPGGYFGGVFRQWAMVYRGDMRERFVKNSRGGGEWPDLAETTKMKRERRPMERIMQDHSTGALSAGEFLTKRKKAHRTMTRSRAKRRAGSTMAFAILRDTGVLFNALSVRFAGLPGQLEEQIPYGIEVGFGGSGTEPNGRITVAQVARWHQDGIPSRRGRVVRKILVEPSATAVAKMTEIIEDRIARLCR